METKDLVESGKKHFESKNYARAEQIFLKVLRTGARYADVLNMLGIIYHSDGKFNNAIESFEKALAINPNYTEATFNLAVLYNDLGEYKKSKNLYAKVQKSKGASSDLDPLLKSRLANMHAAVGDLYRDAGRLQDAIEEYQKALRLCGQFKDIRTKLGVLYRETKKNDLSLKELSAVVSQAPSYYEAALQLGLTHYIMGKKEKAAQVWKGLLASGKGDVAKAYLSLCQNGQTKKAKKLVR